MERYWFKANRYGLGWHPASLQGFVVMLLWLAATVRLTVFFLGRAHESGVDTNLWWYVPLLVVLLLLLAFVAWLTGEPGARGDKK